MVKLALKWIALGGYAFAVLIFRFEDHQLDVFERDLKR